MILDSAATVIRLAFHIKPVMCGFMASARAIEVPQNEAYFKPRNSVPYSRHRMENMPRPSRGQHAACQPLPTLSQDLSPRSRRDAPTFKNFGTQSIRSMSTRG